MAWEADLWWRFADPAQWWMHAMLGLWLLFALMLFATEPLVLHRRVARSPDPARDWQRMVAVHRHFLLLALVTALGAMGRGAWAVLVRAVSGCETRPQEGSLAVEMTAQRLPYCISNARRAPRTGRDAPTRTAA